MFLTNKVRYAVGCLFELSKSPGEFIQGDHIAAQQRIPNAYAHKVLQSLSRAGLIHSHKGLGYKMSRALSDITVVDVFEALTQTEDPNNSNPNISVRLEERIAESLGTMTLDQMTIR